MGDAKECITDDSSATEITDQSLEEDENKREGDEDDGVEEVSEYFSSDEEEDDDNLTLAEQLEIERRNFKEAKLRIANLITQVTEYQVCTI